MSGCRRCNLSSFINQRNNVNATSDQKPSNDLRPASSGSTINSDPSSKLYRFIIILNQSSTHQRFDFGSASKKGLIRQSIIKSSTIHFRVGVEGRLNKAKHHQIINYHQFKCDPSSMKHRSTTHLQSIRGSPHTRYHTQYPTDTLLGTASCLVPN